MNSPPLSWIKYNGRGYLANQMSSTKVAISSAYLFLITAISGQLDPSSIIVKVQICTVFVCIATSGSTSSNSHLILQVPHRSTDSSSQGLMILSSLNGSSPSLTTLVNFISLHVLHVAVTSLHNVDRPGHVKLALTLSSNLLDPGCCKVPWYHSSKLDRSVVGSQIRCFPSSPFLIQSVVRP